MVHKKGASQVSSCTSMTGFARSRLSLESIELVCEARSVNNRFFEFIAKLPLSLAGHESQLRERARKHFERGRVELSLFARSAQAESKIDKAGTGLDQDRFDQMVQQFTWAVTRVSKKKFAVPKPLRAEVAKFALEKSRYTAGNEDLLLEVNQDKIWVLVEETFAKLKIERLREGTALFKDLQARTQNLVQIYSKAKSDLADLPSRMRLQVQRRISELASGIKLDENRLAQEVVHICDRADVTEELVRINGHLSAVENALLETIVGRKLDFLLQELLREFNTLGNKAQNLGVQSLVVDAKLELEKIREQAQNLV